MAHYAFLDENNIVTEVIVGKDEGNFNWEQQYGSFRGQLCKRTSYNRNIRKNFAGIGYTYDEDRDAFIGGVHSNGGTPLRKNFAGIGYSYDQVRDAFIAPKPYSSWVLNEDTCQWEAPVAYPTDGKVYKWNETNYQADNTTGWVEIVGSE